MLGEKWSDAPCRARRHATPCDGLLMLEPIYALHVWRVVLQEQHFCPFYISIISSLGSVCSKMSSPSPLPREENDGMAMARVAWLQSITSHRIVTVSFARALYERCCAVTQVPFSRDAYDSMLEDTTQHLSLLDLELRRYKDQLTGKAMLALVNTKADKLIQGATRYTPQEISFLKKFIEEVFKAKKEAFSLPSMEAVRLGSKLRNTLTQNAAEELLKNLVDHQWIELSE